MLTLTANRPLHWKGRKVEVGETLQATRPEVERYLRTGLLAASDQSRKGRVEVNEITAEEVPSPLNPFVKPIKTRKTQSNDS